MIDFEKEYKMRIDGMNKRRKQLETELKEAEEEQRLEDWLVINSSRKCYPSKTNDLEKEYFNRYGIHYNSNNFRYCESVGWVKN